MLKKYYSYHITYGMNLKITYDEIIFKEDGIVEVIYNRHHGDANNIRELANSPYAYEFAIYDELGDLSQGFEKVEFIKVEENIKDWGFHDKAIFKVKN